MSVRLIDSLPELGGQLTELYPDKYIYDVGGFPKILAKDLVSNLVTQAQYAEPDLHLGETVQSYEREDDHFILKTDQGEYLTRTILITAGVGAFQPRKIGLDNEADFEGTSLQYAVKDIENSETDVVILGRRFCPRLGTDAAGTCKISYTRPPQRTLYCSRTSVQQLMDSPVNVKTSLNVTELKGENDRLKS